MTQPRFGCWNRVAAALLVAAVLGGSPVRAAQKKLTVQEMYELGLKYMKRGYYTKALDQFNRIRNYHRDDPLSVKAELAIGDLYMKKRDWDQARMAYQDFMRMHPRYADLDYVVYKLGLAAYKKAPVVAARDQMWTRNAVDTWAGFADRFPNSRYGDVVAEKLRECRDRLARKELLIARFYARRHAWKAVEGRADGLVTNYPNSTWADEGMVLLATASAWNGESDRARRVVEALRRTDPAAAADLDGRVSRIGRRVQTATGSRSAEDESALDVAPPTAAPE